MRDLFVVQERFRLKKSYSKPFQSDIQRDADDFFKEGMSHPLPQELLLIILGDCTIQGSKSHKKTCIALLQGVSLHLYSGNRPDCRNVNVTNRGLVQTGITIGLFFSATRQEPSRSWPDTPCPDIFRLSVQTGESSEPGTPHLGR